MTDNRATELTATERIRTMLDERSIEYREYHSQLRDSMEPTTRFYLHDSEHKPYATIETGISTCLLTFRCTPEQAIAATLGSGTLTADDVLNAVYKHGARWQAIADELNAELESGTCEWILEHSGTLYDKWRCSKCGYLYVESRTDGGATDLAPNYCPNCGKAVER